LKPNNRSNFRNYSAEIPCTRACSTPDS